MGRGFDVAVASRRTFGGRVAVAAVAAGLGGTLPGRAGAQTVRTLNGSGATFPAPLYSKWADEYLRRTGVQINYQATGSGAGIRAHQDITADFGGTDAPMTDQQLQEARGGVTLHVPMALGAVVPTYNVPALGRQVLRFSPESLTGIFLGRITRWNDPLIAADNPGVNLPGTDIVTVHRSDGSGTTFSFTDYLSNVSPEWKERVGNSTTVNWPGGLGGRGNAGVAGEVQQNPNSIGYVELAYAVQNRLGVGHVRNKAGTYVEPNLQSVTVSAAGALESIPDDLRFSIVNPEGEGSWPISTVTWLLAYRQQRERAKGQALANYMFWCITEGQQYCAPDYAPLPEAMLPLTYSKIQSMNIRGEPLLSASAQLPQRERSREVTGLVDNGDGTATASYSDGTSEVYLIGG